MLRTVASRVATVSSASSRSLVAGAASGVRSKHTLPDLPYDYNALEPAISGQIMELHHDKHHATYVAGLNTAEEQYESALAAKDVKKQIQLQAAMRFNGGGHINHTLFWENLAPHKAGGGELPDGALADAIKRDFGSLEDLKKKVNAAAAGIQGSGWTWVGLDPSSKTLDILTTANQDPLLTHVPVFGIDMWEHAYYLQYKNVKAEYLKNIWDVINFKKAAERFSKAA